MERTTENGKGYEVVVQLLPCPCCYSNRAEQIHHSTAGPQLARRSERKGGDGLKAEEDTEGRDVHGSRAHLEES